MSRPGDWNCRSCSHLNFQRRDSCQRCGDIRPDGRGGGGGGGDFGSSFGGRSGGSPFGGGFAGPDVRPGDWYCSIGNCGAHNFASRSSCFKCGAYKEEAGCGDSMGRSRGGFSFGGIGGGGSGAATGRSGWKSGDWICTRSGCNEHNFASRTECFRCREPRDSGSNSAY
ncbi:hypothetical protein BVRB_2g042990 [Beta vulgaris subsp. vulgaris]|uniref:uncharacterized protein LOC104887671 n=1 Tax=Beta vulgaris subsp. vulgaris TaxID=3555 RepID=UPI00053FC795|nr:uncharacterized protein LOC104887671 [Beta vulgaris subsp. vulgaris]XP_010670663.1 uncharacterized protein LOC104887671 [Beta vulgaris subsp. vulgaris]KMT16812.1 hypothetical protein BVRB_2g042990 [Beta vulgaris subsp. vulgaris]